MSSLELFLSARTKLARAQEQTDALQAEIEQFCADKSHTARETFDPETGRKKAIFSTLPIPWKWSAVIGEVIHDLRSALDSAVYDLTIAEQGGPLDGTEFPVFQDEPKYDETTKKGDPSPRSGIYKVRGVNDRAKALIREAQPFEFVKTHAPNQKTVLELVHELSIIDKHRTIHLVRQGTSQFGWRVVRDVQPIWNAVLPQLEDGAEWGEWVPAESPPEEQDMEFEIAFEIVFGNTTPMLEGQNVAQSCRRLIDGVERLVMFHLAGSLLPPPP